MRKFSQITEKLSTAVTAAVVLVFVCVIGVMTLTKNADMLFAPSGELENDGIKARVTAAFDENIAEFDRFLSIYGLTQRIIGTSVFEDAGYTYVIRDSEENLHFHTTPEAAAPYAEAVAALNETLAAADIPFLYIQAPTKEIDGYTEYPLGINYASVENAADMISELDGHGVEAISLNAVFAELGESSDTRFYRTDHHWTTESAFTAFTYIVPYLNERCGWQLDTELCELSNWTRSYQPQSFLGSAGRRLGAELSGLDDYTFTEPDFETSYNVYYPKISEIYPNWAGSFRDAFVRESVLYSKDVSANRYASYFEYDYGELIIENLLCDNDLRVTIIKDSFALPFTAFLSTVVAEIDMIDLREFEGSVTEHILASKPDLVIMMYSNSSFNEDMYRFDD